MNLQLWICTKQYLVITLVGSAGSSVRDRAWSERFLAFSEQRERFLHVLITSHDRLDMVIGADCYQILKKPYLKISPELLYMNIQPST